jgi:hypothetical protein
MSGREGHQLGKGEWQFCIFARARCRRPALLRLPVRIHANTMQPVKSQGLTPSSKPFGESFLAGTSTQRGTPQRLNALQLTEEQEPAVLHGWPAFTRSSSRQCDAKAVARHPCMPCAGSGDPRTTGRQPRFCEARVCWICGDIRRFTEAPLQPEEAFSTASRERGRSCSPCGTMVS